MLFTRFKIILLKQQAFRLSAFDVFYIFCFEFYVSFADFWYKICVIIVYIGTKCSVICSQQSAFKESLFSVYKKFCLRKFSKYVRASWYARGFRTLVLALHFYFEGEK